MPETETKNETSSAEPVVIAPPRVATPKAPPPPVPSATTADPPTATTTVVRRDVDGTPAVVEPAPTLALLNASKRTLCFAHAAFFATVEPGHSVPVPAQLSALVESELDKLDKLGRNKDDENPVFWELIKL